MIIIWSLVAIVVESLPVQLPNNLAGLTAGFAVAMAAIILGGPLLAVTIFSIAYLGRIRKLQGRLHHVFNVALYKTLFNLCQATIMVGVMSLLYFQLGGTLGKPAILPSFAAILIGIVLNSVIVTSYLSIATGQSFFGLWQESFKGIFLVNTIQGLSGAVIAEIYPISPWIALFSLISVLYIIRYIFKQYTSALQHYMTTMEVINRLLEAKDPYTSGHGSRVQEHSVRLAIALGLKSKNVEQISRAAILHDIGKVGINDAILNKPGYLTDEEYTEIKGHSEAGAQIIEGVSFLQDCVEPIRHHHERYDGKGYPHGLQGAEIPFAASIIAVADSYDAMTSDRPYRIALRKEAALDEIRLNGGKQFHPDVAEAFVAMMGDAEDF